MAKLRIEGYPDEVGGIVDTLRRSAGGVLDFGEPSKPYANRNKSGMVRVYVAVNAATADDAAEAGRVGERPRDASADEMERTRALLERLSWNRPMRNMDDVRDIIDAELEAGCGD